MLKKAEETPLKLGGNVLKVSAVFVPTHDQSVLLAKNLNPKTSKETLQDFVESTKNADVFNVVLGKDGEAIVILKDEIGGYTYTSKYFFACYVPRKTFSRIVRCLIDSARFFLLL